MIDGLSLANGFFHTENVGFLVFDVVSFLIVLFSWLVGSTIRVKEKAGTVGMKVSVTDML